MTSRFVTEPLRQLLDAVSRVIDPWEMRPEDRTVSAKQLTDLRQCASSVAAQGIIGGFVVTLYIGGKFHRVFRCWQVPHLPRRGEFLSCPSLEDEAKQDRYLVMEVETYVRRHDIEVRLDCIRVFLKPRDDIEIRVTKG